MIETTAAAPAAAATAPWRRDLLWLAIGFGALYLLLLGRLPLANPDEGRYAEIPREMLAHGDWVTPRLNETRYFEKPPLVYWCVALCRVAFGPGEFAMRLTPALFGLAGILATYASVRPIYGRSAGILAAVVLGTSLMYVVLSRILLLDMAVSVLITTTLYCFLLAVHEPPGTRRRWLFYGLYVSAALATLAKGLIGFLVPGAVMFLWLLVFNQWRRLRPLYLPSGVLIFLAVAAPWHVLAAQRNPEWAQFYFVREHWQRFTTVEGHDRGEPWWFFIPVVLLGLFPWVGFLGAAVVDGIAGRAVENLAEEPGPSSAWRTRLAQAWTRRNAHGPAWFLLTWAAFIFLFFSKSQSKLIPYVLPVLPPLAILIGVWLARCAQQGERSRLRFGAGVFTFLCGLLAVVALAAVFKPGVIHNPAQAVALRPHAMALAAVLLVGGVGAGWAARVHGVIRGIVVIVGLMIAFTAVLVFTAPDLQRASTRSLALVARAQIHPADRVYHYWAFFHDFVYYSERPVGLVSYIDELEVQFLDPPERARRFIDEAELRRQWAGSARVWLVVRKRDQQAPRSVFADPAFRYHLIAETPTHSLVSNQP